MSSHRAFVINVMCYEEHGLSFSRIQPQILGNYALLGARLIVVRAMYLKSLKFVSGSDQSWRMRLEELAIMGAKNLRSFVLCGSICYVRDAFINPKVTYFLFNGSVKLISSIKLAPAGSSEHLSALRDYLESFDCSEDMSLYIQDAKVYISATLQFVYLCI